MEKEEVIEIKQRMENALQEFSSCLKKLNDAKWLCKVQSNNTCYVFRDVRESVGELLDAEPRVYRGATNGDALQELENASDKKGQEDSKADG